MLLRGSQTPASHRNSLGRHCALDGCSNSVLHLCRQVVQVFPRAVSDQGLQTRVRMQLTLCDVTRKTALEAAGPHSCQQQGSTTGARAPVEAAYITQWLCFQWAASPNAGRPLKAERCAV